MESARAKVKRANELAGELAPHIKQFLASNPALVEFELRRDDQSGLRQAAVMPGPSVVPVDLSIRAGEIVHQLRSSLDHLLAALVKEAGGEVNRSHQFPITQTRQKFEEAVKRGMIAGASPAAVALIEHVQPFHSAAPETAHLSVVQELDNMDKHRILIPMGSAVMHNRATIGNFSGKPISVTGQYVAGWQEPTPQGTVIAQLRVVPPDATIDLGLEYFQQVSVNAAGMRGAPATRSLFELVEAIQQLTWRFRSEFSKT